MLLLAAFVAIQVLIGGTRLLFSLPAYAALAGVGLLAVCSLRRPKPPADRLCLWGTVVFFGYIIARGLLSPVPYIARADLLSAGAGLLVYFWTALFFTRPKARLWFVAALLTFALVHVLVGAVQFREGHNFMPIGFLERADYGRRASGFYVCPNHLAGLLEVLAVLGLAIVCWSRWPVWGKLLVGYAVAICYVGLLLTASRGGYLSALVSLAVFALLSLGVLAKTGAGLFWKIGLPGLLAGAVGLALLLFAIHKSEMLTSRAQNVFETNNMRLDLWQAAIEQWKLAPVTGTGSGTYLFYGRKFRTERMQLDPVDVHNDYLHLLCEYGAVGAVLFAGFLALHLRNGWNTYRRFGPKRAAMSPRLLSNSLALNLGALASVAAYILHSVVDFNLHIPANVLLLAFVFGLVANPGGETVPGEERVTRGELLWRLLPPALAVWLALAAFRFLPGEYFAESARTALRDNHPIDALLFAREGLARENRNPDLYYYLGRARMLQGDDAGRGPVRESFYDAALEAFAAGLALVPQDQTFQLELAFTLDALGRFDEAEWRFDEARAWDPRSTSIAAYYAAHLEQWRRDHAPTQAEPAAEIPLPVER